MTAPREDASALVAFVRKVLAERDETHPHSDYDRESLETGSLNWFHLRALCTLVEQGERDRRRLEAECARLRRVMVVGDVEVSRQSDAPVLQVRHLVPLPVVHGFKGDFATAVGDEVAWVWRKYLQGAAMQPNDSAARTGQEG